MKWEHPVQMLRFTEDANDGIWTDKAHYFILYALAHLIKPEIAIEIGSRRGGSAMWIARAMEELGEGHLHCIDPFVDRYGGAKGFLQHFHFNLKELRLDHRVTLVEKLSSDALEDVPAECDLLFIDGDHSYEGCLSDIANYAPRVRPGGALIIHDSLSEDGVRKAIIESLDLLSDFFCSEVENRQGIWIGVRL